MRSSPTHGRSPPARTLWRRRLLATGMTLAGAVIGALLTPGPTDSPETHQLDILAHQYAYAPHRVIVDQGDNIRLHVASDDVVHGLYLEGEELNAVAYPGRLDFELRQPGRSADFAPVQEVEFTAKRWGKYRYRCSITCGPLHPFMLGELVVRPNYPYWTASGAVVGMLVGAIVLMWTRPAGEPLRLTPAWRLDLLARFPRVKWYVTRRWFQFAFVVPALFFFTVLLVAGFWGSPIGSRNIIITFVWILWWFVLITVLVPFGGRIWCALCPFPFFGEWFQRGRLMVVRQDVRRMWQGFRHWPKRLSNIWLQNVLFLLLCTFSAVLVTRPVVSAFVLGGLILGATVIAVFYRYRAFCNYLCPVSGFLSLYSMASAVEVRAKDPQRCAQCETKACRLGSDNGWGCPWAQTPGRMSRNNYCGMCMECIKTCPSGNMTLRARPFCTDVQLKGYDEAWKAFIMVALAVLYSVTLLGPWGTVKAWANVAEVGDWGGFLLYAGLIWTVALGVLPAVWFLLAWLGRLLSGRPEVPAKALFLGFAYVLVPVGLAAWIAFSFPLIFVNVSHILATASDPMGWGWDLVGLAHVPWRPVWPEYMGYIQITMLLVGLAYGLDRGYRLAVARYGQAHTATRGFLPTAVGIALLTLVFLRLFTG